jgi:hypothetical protein
MGVTLPSRTGLKPVSRFVMGRQFARVALDAADLVEKSEAEDGSFAAHPI